MRKFLLALSGAAVALAAVPAADAKPKTYVCTKWKDGVCVSTHRVKGTAAVQGRLRFRPGLCVHDVQHPAAAGGDLLPARCERTLCLQRRLRLCRRSDDLCGHPGDRRH